MLPSRPRFPKHPRTDAPVGRLHTPPRPDVPPCLGLLPRGGTPRCPGTSARAGRSVVAREDAPAGRLYGFRGWRGRTRGGRLSVAALLIGLMTLAGCGGVEDEGRTVVRLWHVKDSVERVLLQEHADRFNASQDSIRLTILYKETEELRNHYIFGAIGKRGPELIYGPSDNAGILGLTEVVMPLQDVLPAEFLAGFEDEGLLKWEDDLILVADQMGNHLALVYNKALMPEPPQTMDELIEMAQTLTIDADGDGKPEQYGLTWNYSEPFFFVPFLTAEGGWVIDGKTPTLDNAATVRAAQFILDLRDTYKVIPRESDYNIAETLFKEGRAAAIINGSWAWAGYEAAGIDYGIARIPYNTDAGHWAAPMKMARGYSVNVGVTPEKLPSVLAVLQYLTGDAVQHEMAERLSTAPVRTAVLASGVVEANPILQKSLEQLEVAIPVPPTPQLRQIWDGMRGPYQLIMNGNVTAEEGARLMQREAEKRIADTYE